MRKDPSYRDLLEYAPDAIVVTDGISIKWVNTQAVRIFGYSRKEFLSLTIEDLLPVEVRGVHRGHVQEYLANPFCRPMGLLRPVNARKKDGQEFRAEISLSPCAGVIIAIIRDVSERKRIVDWAADTSKRDAIGMLAQNIAHDFNSILGVILGNVSVLQEKVRTQEQMKAQLEFIRKAAEKGVSLSRQIVNFGKFGSDLPPPEGTGVAEAVKEVVSLLQSVSMKGIEFSVEIDDESCRVETDFGRVQQILLNLCLNARDAMPDGGTIRVKVSKADGNALREGRRQKADSHLMISVSDTGVGMDRKTQERIFERRFTTKGERGSGLGLSIIQAIVRASDGFIEIESREGKGTSIRVFLPCLNSH